ncbi:isocitrate/isopropylmalate dehydrogenase family protein [Candidatus Woesearchaeota archaeon]|nr:isocitrate/isopropylmalate dehydrogenase family protein [Candidatus Woesearchaeota archaeon]
MKYKIAVFPGDGVGPELIDEGIRIIGRAAELGKFEIEWVSYPHGAEHYFEAKEELGESVLKDIKSSCSAVYCGTFEMANGQRVPNIIRDYFGQFASIRPVKLLPGVESPLAGSSFDFTVIRENTEGFYIGAAGKAKNGKNKHQIEINKAAFKAKFGLNIEVKGSEIAYQFGVMSRKSCERIAKFAFEYAKSRNKKSLTAVDKMNMLDFHGIWRESFEKISKEFPGIAAEFELIDSAAMNFARQPEKYEIVAAPNMFGDILSDLGTAIQGGLSFAAQGNINPEGISMFEPAHGSAAKLKGRGIVNPIATIWAGALMLDSVGQRKSGDLILRAIEDVLKEGRTRTQDLGGHNSTSEMGESILDRFVEIHD